MLTKEEIENGILNQIVVSDGDLKEMIVNYVGNKIQPENDEVTVAMVIEVLAGEFPEVVLALAEENYIRGYTQGIEDIAFEKGDRRGAPTYPGAVTGDK